jgi:hypothetical protein
MRVRIVMVLCLLVLILSFSRADASLVLGDPWYGLQTVERIQGLQINGALYDVDFNSGAFVGDVPDEAFALSAVIAIVQEFNGDSTGIGLVRDSNTLSNAFIVPYAGSTKLYAGYRLDGLVLSWTANNLQYPPGNMYATFKAVPIPATVLLFGSSLVLIGAIRRRFDK